MLPLHNLHIADFTVDIFRRSGVLSCNCDGSDADWKIVRNLRRFLIIFNMPVQRLVIEL